MAEGSKLRRDEGEHAGAQQSPTGTRRFPHGSDITGSGVTPS
jgi:hypothetical protein